MAIMPLVPDQAPNAGAALSNGYGGSILGTTNLDPEHQIRLTVPQEGGDPLIIIGPTPENISFSIQSGYEQMPGVSENGGALGMAGTTMARVMGASNFSSLFLGSSAQVWSGREYLQVDLPFHLHATSNPAMEVTKVMEMMMMAAVPRLLKGGFMVPPGVNPLTAFKSVGSGLITEEFGITAEIGTMFRLPQLIVLAVDPSIDLHVWKESETAMRSHPMETKMQVSLRSYFAVTDKYIKAMFMESDTVADEGSTDFQRAASKLGSEVHSLGVGVTEFAEGTTAKIMAGVSNVLSVGNGQQFRGR